MRSEKPTFDFTIQHLGEAKITSPLRLSHTSGHDIANYTSDQDVIQYDINLDLSGPKADLQSHGLLEKAGPREKIYFNPRHVHAAILTCGGLCPGLNDVIRNIVRTLSGRYGVQRITGVKFGFHGFLGDTSDPLIELDPGVVDDIHRMGGSMLGSSRGGGERTEEIVDAIERMNLNMLFVIGGDGTQKGAGRIADEIKRRGEKISVIGVPKTIDNDLLFTDRSFGFETAVMRATEAVYAAHQEADSAFNGIGIVKVMGRDSGFIAAATALASHDANFVLVPEVPFELDGPNGFFEHLKRRLERRAHAVILIAEGAGQDKIDVDLGTDASGNRKLGDIGTWLRDKIHEHFHALNFPVNIKYIDPSYMIRSSVAVASDSFYCTRLASNAVHAAMAGKTKMIVSLLHNNFVHVPIDVATTRRNKIDPAGSLWLDVLQATGMPVQMTNDFNPSESEAESV